MNDLESLLSEIRACRVCRDAPLYGAALPHEPRPVFQISQQAQICVAGQAPGARVHASGRPFTDPSGVRLRKWLAIDEDTFYDPAKIAIVPMGFCFPGNDKAGGDLPPRRECAPLWQDRVFESLPNLWLVLLIGQYTQHWHLDREEVQGGVTGTVARWREILERPGRTRILPLPHPSWRNNGWIRNNPWFEAELLPVLRAEVAALLEP